MTPKDPPLRCGPMLLLLSPCLLLLPPRRLLPLLTVHDQKDQRRRETEDGDALHDAVVKIERVAAGHGLVFVHVVVEIIVILVILLEKVIEPVGERPFLLDCCEARYVSSDPIDSNPLAGTYLAHLE